MLPAVLATPPTTSPAVLVTPPNKPLLVLDTCQLCLKLDLEWKLRHGKLLHDIKKKMASESMERK